MLGRTEAEAILREALGASEADAAEAVLSGGSLALTRFAENAIHQNVAERNVVLSVRSIIGKRSGSATTSRLDALGVRGAARLSESIARAMRDEAPPPDVAPRAALPEDALDSEGPAWGAADRQEAVARIVARCREAGLTAAGFALAAEGELSDYGEHAGFAVANTNGLFAYARRARAPVSATAIGPTSSRR